MSERTERPFRPMESVSRFYGKFRGTVSDNEDPRSLGRLTAHVPEVLGDVETGWALPCAPYAGDGSGQFTLPPVGAGVWIEFESGDVSRPIWSGCWWGEGHLPESNSGGQATADLRIIRSEQGLMLSLDDGSKTIHVSDGDGCNMLEIRVQAGKVTLKAAMKAIVEAPQIELVENGMHPIVFGDNLMQYLSQLVTMFNAHLHPGELALGIFPVTPAPPVPPLVPPTPALLSMKVKAG